MYYPSSDAILYSATCVFTFGIGTCFLGYFNRLDLREKYGLEVRILELSLSPIMSEGVPLNAFGDISYALCEKNDHI